jgi:hypothetical protein
MMAGQRFLYMLLAPPLLSPTSTSTRTLSTYRTHPRMIDITHLSLLNGCLYFDVIWQ